MRFRKLIFLMLFMMLGALPGCDGALVNEAYGQLNTKSINGLDAFYSILKSRGYEVSISGYLTETVLKESDLIVYVEKGKPSREDLAVLEAWMRGENREDLEARLQEKFEKEQNRDKTDKDDDDKEKTDKDDEDKVIDNSVDVNEFKADLKKSKAQKYRKALKEKPRPVVLYFKRDTDASIHFWKRMVAQMQDYEDEREYCKEQLDLRIERQQDSPGREEDVLGGGKLAYSKGLSITRLKWDDAVFPTGVESFPVRHVYKRPRFSPLWNLFALEEDKTETRRTYAPIRRSSREDFVSRGARSSLNTNAFYYKSLLSSASGYDLIREYSFYPMRFIHVFNSEPILNESLVLKKNRKLTLNLLDYIDKQIRQERASEKSKETTPADAKKGKAKKIRVGFVGGALRSPGSAAKDEDMLRLFRVYPINVIILHLAILLILFLFSRWPHGRPPREMLPEENREFLEHIKALGKKLRISKNNTDALGGLVRWKLLSRREGADEKYINDYINSLYTGELYEKVRKLWSKD